MGFGGGYAAFFESHFICGPSGHWQRNNLAASSSFFVRSRMGSDPDLSQTFAESPIKAIKFALPHGK